MSTSPKAITLEDVRTHNLKHLNLSIPHGKLVVITGRSGSGKSSLAFDTLFAEGQLIYLESLNAYARQFLGKIERPPVKSIKGLLPTIGMQQKTKNSNPRARVATSADLYAYLKVLYARLGTTYSPISGQPVKRHSVEDVIGYIQTLPAQSKIYILAPFPRDPKITWEDQIAIELGKGFTRLFWKESLHFMEDLRDTPPPQEEPLYLLVDRFRLTENHNDLGRLADSIQTAFVEGHGICHIHHVGGKQVTFSDRFEADGMRFELPSLQFFSFNNSYGACPQCRGWGKFPDIDEKKVIPKPNLSLQEGAIFPWESPAMKPWKNSLFSYATAANLPLSKPYKSLTPTQKEALWQGDPTKGYQGIDGFFSHIGSHLHKVSYRILQARYRTFQDCRKCRGSGLRPDAHYVKIAGKSLIDLMDSTIETLAQFFQKLTLPPDQEKVGKVLLESIRNKINYLVEVGLGYLLLKRRTNTLSGGEYQRLRIGKLLGNPLVNALYILDEPTIGLHPRDTHRLIEVLSSLQEMNNTLIIVEHEEAVMRAAHHIIDIGPQSGSHGGQVVFQGNWQQLLKDPHSETAAYLTGKKEIAMPPKRKPTSDQITLTGINLHNLQDLTVHFPLARFIVITGVSGSGKSTLVEKVLYPSLCRYFDIATPEEMHYRSLTGNLEKIQSVEYLSQSGMGKSSRSNIATYLKVYEHIRKLYAAQPLAQERGYLSHHFSFNIDGGRCQYCLGEGKTTIDMHFMADVDITCNECHGKRFKESLLQVRYKGKNIADVLALSVDEALDFFHDINPITQRLTPVQKVGLGYLQIGQPLNQFSSGEAQRVKLSTYLVKKDNPEKTLFIFDEPTTGLHFHDIQELLNAFQELVNQGHSLIVIEHNTDVIKCADWVIDMGPESGEKGGEILFAGTPEALASQNTHTARFLKEKFPSS